MGWGEPHTPRVRPEVIAASVELARACREWLAHPSIMNGEKIRQALDHYDNTTGIHNYRTG